MDKRVIPVGRRVIVNIPIGASPGCVAMRKLNGTERVVSFRKWHKNGVYYELAGVRSSEGIPFSFLGEWLEEITDEVLDV